MPIVKFFFLAIILLSNIQLQTAQTKDKANSSEKECDFTVYKPRRVSDFPNPNAVIEKVVPEYPELARKAHIKGTVTVKILVDRGGNVIEACAIQGHPLLRKAAVTAALKWKFKTWCSLCPQETFVESIIDFRFNTDETTNKR
jgi:TonB family protein